jgi:hypothetical protein
LGTDDLMPGTSAAFATGCRTFPEAAKPAATVPFFKKSRRSI